MTRARRGRGEASIYQRESDGRWCASVSVGYADTGKRRRKIVYGDTKHEAQAKLKEALSEATFGVTFEAGRQTVGEHLDRWLASVKKSLSPNSHTRYQSTVKLQLKPFIGGLRLSKLAPVHIEALYATLADAKCSPRNIQLAGVTLGAALDYAVSPLKLIPFNPVRGIDKPAVPKAKMQTWDKDQATAFLQAAKGDRFHALYVLALVGGLRQGELLALAWNDIKLDGGYLMVQQSLEEINGVVRLKDPKSGKGRRIDLPPVAIKALRAHRAAMLKEGNIAGPVFCAPEGGFVRKGNLHNRSFKPLVKAAGVPDIRFHDLRHTSATLLLEAGESPKVVQERLGHSTVRITLDIYGHVTPTMQKGAADKMQGLLG